MKEIVIKGLNEKIYYHKLPEGLQIYLWPNEKIKGTYMSLMVPYGSIHTSFKVGKKNYQVPNGVAHFLEHVKFNMAKDKTAHEVFQKLGGEANAFTTFKYTNYIVYTAEKVTENLNTLLDYVYTPYFTKSLINKEKGIIVEESKMNLDDPYSVSYFAFLKQILKKSNYRFEITGLPEDINKITLADIENVYKAFYHPQNMFLIVTGNINPYEIIKTASENLAGKEFSNYVKAELPKIKEPQGIIKNKQELNLNITAAEFRYALKIPRAKFKNLTDRELMYYLYILGQMLFGPSSEFREELRAKELMASFHGGVNLTDDCVIVTFHAVTDYPNEIEAAIDEKVANWTLDEADFKRKIKAEIANLILKYDDVIAVNEQIQNDLITLGKIEDNTKEILENMTITKMQEVAKAITLENKATMIIKPNL